MPNAAGRFGMQGLVLYVIMSFIMRDIREKVLPLGDRPQNHEDAIPAYCEAGIRGVNMAPAQTKRREHAKSGNWQDSELRWVSQRTLGLSETIT